MSIREKLRDGSLGLAELMEIVDEMQEENYISTEDLLENLCRAMGTDELRKNLEYIARMFDM